MIVSRSHASYYHCHKCYWLLLCSGAGNLTVDITGGGDTTFPASLSHDPSFPQFLGQHYQATSNSSAQFLITGTPVLFDIKMFFFDILQRTYTVVFPPTASKNDDAIRIGLLGASKIAFVFLGIMN